MQLHYNCGLNIRGIAQNEQHGLFMNELNEKSRTGPSLAGRKNTLHTAYAKNKFYQFLCACSKS